MKLSNRILIFELDRVSSLLVNPITGAIDVAPKKLLDEMPNLAREHLNKRGYFLSEDERIDMLTTLKSTYEQHSQNAPYWFYVLTTLNCNFGCPICYERQTLENSEITPQKLEDIIKVISGFQKEHQIPDNRMNLVIFGGEPLCVSDSNIVRQILEASSRHNWKDVIVTNGSKVKKFIDMFVEYSETISDFRITLDGPQSIHDSRRPYRGGKGSFTDVVGAIDLLIEKHLPVKMQTILGSGNISHFEDLIEFVQGKGWLQNPFFQWRIEGSHDYANLDPQKDEISEGKMVKKLIQSWEEHQELRGKMKFESFKYLGHIVRGFGWLGDYKTYWGPKYGFCEPQKGFHYVFSTNGNIYHCPRTINNANFCVGNTEEGIVLNEELKHRTILDKPECFSCSINTLCGGGCVVQKKYYSDFDCKEYALSVILEFIDLMRGKILEKVNPNMIVSINNPW